ncbi:hypothetical protein ACFL0R_01560 [Pseudomonadota bacterium]
MIKNIRSILLLACVMQIGMAHAIDYKTHYKEYFQLSVERKNNQTYSYDVPRSKIGSLPKWDGKNNPPISINEAVGIAASKMMEETGAAQTSLVELKLDSKVKKCKEGDCQIDFWYYKIELMPGGRYERANYKKRKTYIVLMDGSFGVRNIIGK